MDVLAFIGILALYIWFVEPRSELPLAGIAIVAGLCTAAAGLRSHGATWKRSGIRIDNLRPALVAYGIVAAALAGGALLRYHDRVSLPAMGPHLLVEWITYCFWGLAQQFCLLGFLLVRLREITGRDVSAVLLAASIFAFFHLPNPFLTVYSLVAGLASAGVFLRWPNLFAAAAAHATAARLVIWLLPRDVIGGMAIGPKYWN
jgi:hypothetical protein